MSERERETMSEALQQERSGLVLKTVGWVLLGMDFLLLVFVWISLRSGSLFWLIWVLAQAFLGLLLIRIGIGRRAHASRKSGKSVV